MVQTVYLLVEYDHSENSLTPIIFRGIVEDFDAAEAWQAVNISNRQIEEFRVGVIEEDE